MTPTPSLQTLRAQIEKVKSAFDALLIREVQVFGGIPTHAGRTGAEQTALREALAELLEVGLLAALDAPQGEWQPMNKKQRLLTIPLGRIFQCFIEQQTAGARVVSIAPHYNEAAMLMGYLVIVEPLPGAPQ